MTDYWAQFWDWLADKDHRERILVIIAILGVIGGSLRWVFGLFKGKSPGGQTASSGSVNIGGNVSGDVITGGKTDGNHDSP